METVSLASLCSRISSGGTPSRKHPEYFADEGGHLWVKSQELVDRPISDTSEKISDLGLAKSSAKYYDEDTVLIAMYGATVGQLAILKAPATVNQAVCALCVDPEIADYRYVFYALMATRYDLTVQAAGAAQQNLNQGLIRDFEIPIYPLDKQRWIASVLGSLDDLIENNWRRIEILEEMARLIYREWFVYFRFPGHEDVALVDSDIGLIPEGWEIATLDSVASLNERSLREGYDVGEILYVDISSVGLRTIDPPEAMDFSDAPGRARRLVAAGDTIWSTVRPNRRSHALLVDPPSNMVCSTGFAVLTPKAVPSSFLFETTSTDEFTAHLTGLATGSAYPAVRPPDFECFTFALPPTELQEQFDQAVGPMHQLQHTLSEQNHVLAEARNLLLPRLISGELDVSDLDLDLEPVA